MKTKKPTKKRTPKTTAVRIKYDAMTDTYDVFADGKEIGTVDFRPAIHPARRRTIAQGRILDTIVRAIPRLMDATPRKRSATLRLRVGTF